VDVDQSGTVLNNLSDRCYMGEVDLPHLIPAPEPSPAFNPQSKKDFTLTGPQKYSREHWKNQHTSADEQRVESNIVVPPAPAPVQPVCRTRAYILYDQTLFYPDGEVIKTLPEGVTAFPASDPPGYQQGSHILGEYTLDVPWMVWRKK